eukprot:426161-Pyramimonas_sp.AAC.1
MGAEAIAKQSGLECEECNIEREKRKLVATSLEDARLREENSLKPSPLMRIRALVATVGNRELR